MNPLLLYWLVSFGKPPKFNYHFRQLKTNIKITDALAPVQGNQVTNVTFRSNAKLMRYVQSFDALPIEEPIVEPSAEPTPTPTPSFAQMLHQMFSGFVSSLFGGISRIFGRP